MSVRRITNGGKKVIGKFPSRKMGRAVWYESQLERDYIYLLEIDADVIAFKEQPFKIKYLLGKESHTYTPDFLVNRTDRRQVIEVKEEKEAKKEENQAFFNRMALICQEDGLDYLVATDTSIRQQPRLGNVKVLHKYSRIPVTHEHHIHAYAFFSGQSEATLSEVMGFFVSRGASRQVVYALIYWGVLWIDISVPFGPESIVRMPMAQYLSVKEKKVA